MLGDQRFFERKITAPRALQFTSMGQEAIPISSNEMRKIHRGGEGSSSQSAAGRKVNVSQSRREQPVGEPGKPGKAPKEPKEKAKHPILRFIGRTIATLLCLGIMAGSLLAVGMVFYVVQATANDGDLLDLDNIQLSQSSVVMANDPDTGAQVEYATLRSSNSHRVWADLEQIPTNLQYAFICTEDKDFYNEPGVNFKRTIGAMVNEYLLPIYSSKQGASTLEQQLIKNLTDDNSASGIEGALRKLREIYRALCLSRSYSKETILEAYLNTISFTGTIQGVQTAANEYFNKDVSELTLWECATIASITKNPTNYNPYTNPENLINRRNFIMYNMWQQGVISEEDYRNAAAQPLTLAEDDSDKKNTSVTSYFTDALFQEVVEDIMAKEGISEADAQKMLYTGGFTIEATVNTKLQSQMENLMLNTNDAYFPAGWHEEEVTSISDDDVQVMNEDGTLAENTGAFATAYEKEAKENHRLHVFVAEVDGETKYVFPVYGAGLWGAIWGYVALNSDKDTVYGVYFSHASETPGLGAEIATTQFQGEFPGKKTLENGEIALGVVKNGKVEKPDYQVDGISGGTITSVGVDAMLKTCLSSYKNFLTNNNEEK